ncbi:MerR family transcriptional regulator [Weizmannia acidilactici]|uniref:MerR family transcriptional regulator n=1 Tax=Weizmannia acidilactici TaxID=2607726 RepID=A0A5J4JGQ6_9BACI|nr:MerR family transcriptional regulator [Weizmannia acidilactici]GER69835.1 MerR family transcriptional regulator [Weizmannia acidilactici]GER75167.1 MerR family transcriptional regulator [Weizmannia acidilactici]
MRYTIGEVAKITGFSKYTLRYYDKQGLLPFLDRTENGIRIFKDSDLSFLSVISCLKETGMSIKEIREFVKWCMEGDSTLALRLKMFEEHKKAVEEQIKNLQKNLEKINHKIWYYQTALEAGTEAIHTEHNGGKYVNK